MRLTRKLTLSLQNTDVLQNEDVIGSYTEGGEYV